MTEFVLNHSETVADELGSADSYLVLVLNPFLVIDLNQGIQNIFRLLDGSIVNAEIDDGRILIAKFRTKVLGVIVGSAHNATLMIGNGSTDIFLVEVLGGRDIHTSHRGLDGVIERTGNNIIHLFTSQRKVGKSELFLAVQLDLESNYGVLVFRYHRYGGCFVELYPLQSIADGIGLVQSQTLHHFGHERGRRDGKQFIVDIGIALEHAEVSKVVAQCAACRTALAIVLHQDGGGTGIYIRSTQYVEYRHGERNHQRQGEPIPFGEEHPPEVLDTNEVIGGLVIRFSIFHKTKSFCC